MSPTARPSHGARLETYSVSEVERISGLSSDELHWYEEFGLIDDVGQEPGGQRVYSAVNLRWLEFLNRLRSTGMPVEQMRRYVELARAGDHTVAERRALLSEHRRLVLAHVEELNATVNYLNWQISFYQEKEVAMGGR
ncbi:MerR family transcriptional regulator [Kitasatospora sp. NPDC052896]|uniref:MerR family transcriptional regulator n=1 Tax=Kitasatospora sp. NPDC052896 TaxID=3364061 RepID=UPI0037C5D034